RFNHFEMLVSFSLGQYFTHTEDWSESVGKSQYHLLLQDLSSFMIISSSFTVSQDHILSAGRCNHFSRYLTGISTGSLVGTVLCSNTYFGSIHSTGHACQMNKRRTDYHLAKNGFIFQCFVQCCCQGNAFLQVLIHFPVTCDNVLSH